MTSISFYAQIRNIIILGTSVLDKYPAYKEIGTIALQTDMSIYVRCNVANYMYICVYIIMYVHMYALSIVYVSKTYSQESNRKFTEYTKCIKLSAAAAMN